MMKKILCMLLIVCMLVPAFASCTDDPVIPPADDDNGLDAAVEADRIKLMVDGVSQYTLIRSDAAKDQTALKMIQKINRAIRDRTGGEMSMDSDWDKKDMTKYEILVGDTNRPETAEVLAGLGDYNFAVKQVGNKIVIAGKNEYAVTAGVNYFIDEYIDKNGNSAEGYFSIPKDIDYTEQAPDLLVVAEGLTSNYAITYTKDWGDRYNYSYYDYELDEKTVATELQLKLRDKFGAKFNTAMDYVYNEETIDDLCEILLGNCDRVATTETKASLAYNEYAIKVIGNKIVVTGLGFLSTYEALNKLISVFDQFKITENGTTKLIIPNNFNYVGVYENGEDWLLDLPVYQGGKFDSASDLGIDSGSYVLKIKDTSVDEYNAYLSTLEAAGYTKYTSNEIEGNLFATYTSDKKGTLRVQFAPVYSQTSIIVEPSDVILPALESENTAAAVTTTKLVQLKISNEASENGQCHIFRLNNGKFIVFDGGGEAASSDLIYDKLVELNVLDGKPVIAAWIFTHHHGDHTGTFTSRFSKTYKSKVTIESYIYSFPSEYYLKEDAKGMNTWKSFDTATKGADHVVPHAGDVWYYGDLKMTCLYTQDELLPDTFEFFNDSSLVFMFEIGGQKILITGDASENVCGIIVDMYPTYLKCDILQYPHHGHYGATRAFTMATDPWCVLIPASKERWQNKLRVNTYTGAVQLRYLLSKSSVKEYYIHGLGTVEFDLPYAGK